MIRIYSEKEIEALRRGGRILARIIEELKEKAKPGIKTKYLNKVAKDLVLSFGAEPSFEGFNGFPAALCTSINEEIVHAVPGKRKLKEGDILSLDLGIRFEKYCTDMAITMLVEKTKEVPRSPSTTYGTPSRQRREGAKKLIKITKEALKIGIKQAKAGNHLQDIGWAIQNYVEKNGFNVVRELVGHGVGKEVHEAPKIPNYGNPGQGPKLKQGMVLALEPMVTVGDWHVEKTKDGFGYRTLDNSLSAHFEHTIAITPKGPKILTKI